MREDIPDGAPPNNTTAGKVTSRGAAVVFRSRDREACLEARLVLDAAGIEADVGSRAGEWALLVDGRDRLRALEEFDAYRRENVRRSSTEQDATPLLPGGGPGVFGYAGVLVGFALLTQGSLYGVDWQWVGRMQTGLVVEGEWWRVFTALTLHLDTAHLLANLVFGAVFGFFVAQALGSGVGWLGIVLGGGLGNAMNAIVQPAQHSAVGASTAIFSALGILVSHTLYHRWRIPGGPVRRWSPLIGGVLLFVYTGTGGERTDVVAHVTGLLAGLLIGALGSRISIRFLQRRGVQIAAASSVVGLLLFAWMLALRGL